MPRTLALAGKYQSLILTALVLVSLERIEEVKAKYPKVSYADLYQLAGVVPVEVTGGPTMDFVPGRKDSLESPVEGCLPDAEQGKLWLVSSPENNLWTLRCKREK
ncbi:Putative L-ascorbate peroxidase 3 [Glycine soja]|nr:Putative L-ascorbate peroxidase 3 [Glycine soja]